MGRTLTDRDAVIGDGGSLGGRMSTTAFEMAQFESPRGEKSTRESKQWLGCLLPQREKVGQKEGKSDREKER